jgi:uncharacterized membrane protein
MDYIISAFTMLTLDAIYLSNIGGPLFNPMIKDIQGEKMTVNFYGAIIVYILMLFILYKLIIKERKSPNDAFLLGFCIYGVFDFTNIAIFKKYKYFVAILDMIWGGILFYITTWITYKLLKIQI